MDHSDPWILTRSGIKFSLFDPKPEMVLFSDIVSSLANLCRFTGQTQQFYSVAQHSVHVASMLPDDLKIAGLLHDAAEAYIGDMSKPLKQRMLFSVNGKAVRVQEAEERILRCVFDHLREPWPTKDHWEAIKFADEIALHDEFAYLMPKHPEIKCSTWESRFIDPLPPHEAHKAFMRAWWDEINKLADNAIRDAILES